MSVTYHPDKIDLTDETIEWNLNNRLSYGQYLRLDQLLACQQPVSAEHDELLFIVIHQTSELWMKVVLHELQAACRLLAEDDLNPVFKVLSRVQRVQEQLIQSWNVLATMTPHDYIAFRDKLGPASGLQSYQYRLLEFCLGNKNAELIEVHKSSNREIYQILQHALAQPSIYDESLRLLQRRGFDLPGTITERDWRKPYHPDQAVEAAWRKVYEDIETYWDFYELGEKLVDIEQKFQQWRFNHMKTVERIIGYRRGTGGSGGVSYLAKALELSFFPELWSVRTAL